MYSLKEGNSAMKSASSDEEEEEDLGKRSSSSLSRGRRRPLTSSISSYTAGSAAPTRSSLTSSNVKTKQVRFDSGTTSERGAVASSRSQQRPSLQRQRSASGATSSTAASGGNVGNRGDKDKEDATESELNVTCKWLDSVTHTKKRGQCNLNL